MATADDSTQSRRIAEQARPRRWAGASFVRELCLGRLRPELLAPLETDPRGLPDAEFQLLYQQLERFARLEIDPAEIDETGEYPPRVVEGLARLGAFGLKIDREYGGLGLSNLQYVRVMQMLGSYDGNITALLSAHQSIGVPHPLQLFGSETLKQRYLPMCARGAISAFALTEPSVGSDPARLATRARLSEDGTHYVLDGLKLWCTNGTLARVIVVLARDPATNRISCFVVEMDWEGVRVERRCHFMGLRALGNALISFRNVRVPRENVIGNEGDGLRVALATLNTGRLTLPAATAGAAKLALEICRKWCSVRVQWGRPIGEHEAIAHELANMACVAYAMESLAFVVGALADRDDRDVRLEAAAAKEWNTVAGWHITDTALQIRGGRGYENERSLAARGEPPVGIERMLRDCRVNRIFEGSSEIMHLFIAREALDRHLQLAGALFDPEQSATAKLAALPRVVGFYAWWYPGLWLAGLGTVFRFRQWGELGRHLRFAERRSRRLARALFHAMLRHGPGLERRQALLFRAVDVALELFALVSTVLRAHAERDRNALSPQLAEQFAQDTRRRIQARLAAMRRNDDGRRYELGRGVLVGQFEWLERGIVHPEWQASELVPMSVETFIERIEPTVPDRGTQHAGWRA
jgi:alkylation response protein AidB-like acyl-CoA dehydrogenase